MIARLAEQIQPLADTVAGPERRLGAHSPGITEYRLRLTTCPCPGGATSLPQAPTGLHPTTNFTPGPAAVRSYLSIATKWGKDKLQALTELCTADRWLPPALLS